MPTEIEWTDETWNPVTGCTKVSPGCDNCYAERISNRFKRGFDVQLHEDRLEQPLRWRKPRMVFVCSMGDLFHQAVPDEFIDQVLAVMALSWKNTFQVLTKRPRRMVQYLSVSRAGGRHIWPACQAIEMPGGENKPVPGWPLPNVWLGTSVENQATADQRIPHLLATPAAVRFVSAEPLLGPLDFLTFKFHMPNWVIVGGESGPGARPMDPDWARSIRDQCKVARGAFFMKQMGGHPNKRGKLEEIPEDLRIREYPNV